MPAILGGTSHVPTHTIQFTLVHVLVGYGIGKYRSYQATPGDIFNFNLI